MASDNDRISPNPKLRAKREAAILDTLSDAQDYYRFHTRIQKTLGNSIFISLILGFLSMGFLAYTHGVGWDFGSWSPAIPGMAFTVALFSVIAWFLQYDEKVLAEQVLKRAERAFRDFNLE